VNDLFTSEVAKLLGVSQSTVQRWVKQLGLPMEKNERGHYLFKKEDIGLLKEIKVQIQNGVLLQDINPIQDKKSRKGSIKSSENDKAVENLVTRIIDLETKLNAKADSVASYQLLQHRSEIEELQNHIKILMERIEKLENQIKPFSIETPLDLELPKSPKKSKKKNIVRSLFGF
jgi:chromosome-anchoring protein RacA